MLSEKALIEFKKIWVEDHPDVEIDQEELKQQACRVMEAVKSIYGEDQKKKFIQ